MSGLDRYWSFKLVLKDAVDSDLVSENQEGPGISISVPFLAKNSLSSQPAPSVDTQKLYWLEETMELAEPTNGVDAAIVAAQSLPPQEPVFVQPSADELEKLSISELSSLRRRLAVMVHPDRIGKAADLTQQNAMGICNQMIDAAIRKKQ